jgi:predicted transcriptional regulator
MTKLKSVLKEQGRSQEWLSKQTGISIWRINRIVNGQEAKESEIIKISKALGFPKDLLFFNPILSNEKININIEKVM